MMTFIHQLKHSILLGYTQVTQKQCSDVNYSFNTISEAQNACTADSNCRGVYDINCDGAPVIKLCLSSGTYQSSASDCIYDKPSGKIKMFIKNLSKDIIKIHQ